MEPTGRHFRYLAVGSAVSSYGTFLGMVALSLFAYHVTDSALWTGLFMAVRLAAGFTAGLVAGRVVSRLDRKRVMVAGDLTQAVALVGVIALPHTAAPAALFGIALVTGGCATLSGVALRSSVPEIVGPDRRVQANALLVTGRSLAMVAGFASAGLVITAWGYPAALLIDAATFVFSAANLARLPLRTGGGRAAAGTVPEPEPGTRWKALWFLRATPVLAAMIGLRAVDAFGSASHSVGLPVLSTTLDPAHPAGFMSRFWTTWAIGNLLAQRAVAWWVRHTGRAVGEHAFAAGACVMSAAFIVTFLPPPFAAGVLVALVAGLADGFTEIAYTSRLQAAPDHWRGYVFGFSAMAENLGFGAGMVLVAALLEYASPRAVTTAFHGTAIVLFAAFLVLRAVRRGGAGDRAAPTGAAPHEAAPREAGA